MKAILKEDIKNPHVEPRKQEVPTTKEEQIAFKKANRHGTPVPQTKMVNQPVFYGKTGDKLEVFPSKTNEGYRPEEIQIFVLISVKGDRFHVKKEQITLIQ